MSALTVRILKINVFLLLILLLISCDKEISSKCDVRKNHLKGPVKTVIKHYFYGLNPFTIGQKEDDPFPMESKDTINYHDKIIEKYNLDGNLTEVLYIRKGFKFACTNRIVYIYEGNILAKSIEYNLFNNKIDTTIKNYIYNTDKLIQEIKVGKEKKSKTTFDYYSIGHNLEKYKIENTYDSIFGYNITSMRTVDNSGRIIVQDDFDTYSDSDTEISDMDNRPNKILETTTWEYFENYSIKTRRIFDDDSRISFEVINIGPNGDITSIFERRNVTGFLSESDSILYHYGNWDPSGNWLRKTILKRGLTFIMKREIEYY